MLLSFMSHDSKFISSYSSDTYS